MSLSQKVVLLRDTYADAIKFRSEFGITRKYSTGDKRVDDYLGGGFGKRGSFEIVVLYGRPGIGKSSFALKMLAKSMLDGKKIAAMFLEDDMTEIHMRMEAIVGIPAYEKIIAMDNVELLPDEATDDMWQFDEILEWIQSKHEDSATEIFFIDHIQFLFENEDGDSRDAYQRQRIFMKKLNRLCKKTKTTVVLISHVNKNQYAKGTDKMVGTGALAGVVTKAIEVFKDEDGKVKILLTKSRYTRDHTEDPLPITIYGRRAQDVFQG
jgi:predicted ATP-dependent serine protease